MMRAGVIVSVFVAVLLLGGCGRRAPEPGPVGPATAPGSEGTAVPGAARTPAETQAAPPRHVVVYDCNDGSTLVTEVLRDGKDILVSLPGRSVRLAREDAASGAKYSNRGVTFWSEGAEASLWLDGRRIQCNENSKQSQLVGAKTAGALVLASGNEPGWTLEVHSERLVWTTDLGKRRVELAVGPPDTEPASGATVYRAELDGAPFVATLKDEPCRDDMSGETFSISVVIEHAGKTLRGCGTRLQ